MKRRVEKRLLIAGALWNIFTAILTIIGYAPWFKEVGVHALSKQQALSYNTSSLLDNVASVIMLFGLLMLSIGIVNLLLVQQIKQLQINKKLMVWLGLCTVLHFLSFDVVGTMLYSLTVVLYGSRNKAIRLAGR